MSFEAATSYLRLQSTSIFQMAEGYQNVPAILQIGTNTMFLGEHLIFNGND